MPPLSITLTCCLAPYALRYTGNHDDHWRVLWERDETLNALAPILSLILTPAASYLPLPTPPASSPTGNHDDYWRVLWERGNLRREDLENFSRPLKCESWRADSHINSRWDFHVECKCKLAWMRSLGVPGLSCSLKEPTVSKNPLFERIDYLKEPTV